ncbi:MAG: FHA domain-containing protein [Myxococcaceae bacterium]|nr:FHA domain-containing protein [Myxococcaceae bacterium]
MSTVLTVEVRTATGKSRTLSFDSAFDRRVIIGRSAECDLCVEDSGVSRKNTMLIATPAGWQVHDLGSSNGTRLNGERVRVAPCGPGDVVAVGETQIVLISAGAPPAELVVDLEAGRATVGDVELPLSAAELIWFGFLAAHRTTGDGWAQAGRDGHAALARWSEALLGREWAAEVKTRPLLDLARGHDVDDEDLKNLRGKTAQKLKAFCTGELAWLAALVVPEVLGKNRQRVPAANVRLVAAPAQ